MSSFKTCQKLVKAFKEEFFGIFLIYWSIKDFVLFQTQSRTAGKALVVTPPATYPLQLTTYNEPHETRNMKHAPRYKGQVVSGQDIVRPKLFSDTI